METARGNSEQLANASSMGHEDPELASYDIVQAIGQLTIEHYLEGTTISTNSLFWC